VSRGRTRSPVPEGIEADGEDGETRPIYGILLVLEVVTEGGRVRAAVCLGEECLIYMGELDLICLGELGKCFPLATAAAGPVAFVALASPQIARRLVGERTAGIIPAAFVGAAIVASENPLIVTAQCSGRSVGSAIVKGMDGTERWSAIGQGALDIPIVDSVPSYRISGSLRTGRCRSAYDGLFSWLW
jgi:hypothetical protein